MRDALVDMDRAGDAVGPQLGVVRLGLGAEHVALRCGDERRRNVLEAFVRVEERARLRVRKRGAALREVDLTVPDHLGGGQLRGQRVLRPRELRLARGGVVGDGDNHHLEADWRKPAGERRRCVAVAHDRREVPARRRAGEADPGVVDAELVWVLHHVEQRLEGVVHTSWEGELRRQAVVDGDDDALCPVSEVRAVRVLGIDAAEHPAAAMVPDRAGPAGGRALAVRDKDPCGDAAGVELRVLAWDRDIVGLSHGDSGGLPRDDVPAGLGVRHRVLVCLEDVRSLAEDLAEKGDVLRVELVHHGRVEREREGRKGLRPAVVVVELGFENRHGSGWVGGCVGWLRWLAQYPVTVSAAPP